MVYKHLKSRMLQMPPRVHARMPLQLQSDNVKPFALDEQRDVHVKIVEDMNALRCLLIQNYTFLHLSYLVV